MKEQAVYGEKLLFTLGTPAYSTMTDWYAKGDIILKRPNQLNIQR